MNKFLDLGSAQLFPRDPNLAFSRFQFLRFGGSVQGTQVFQFFKNQAFIHMNFHVQIDTKNCRRTGCCQILPHEMLS